MVIMVCVWLSIEQFTHGHFDPGFVVLVLILTIQTSLDSQATKLFQMSLRKKDQKREREQEETLNHIADMSKKMERLLEEGARRDAVMYDIINALDDTVEKIREILPNIGDTHP